MKLTTYFLKHPVIAIILNGLIFLVGLICLNTLPVREYPDISFPVITVKASYPNASPSLIESDVTNVLEDQLAGVEGLELITSQSNPGNAVINLLFRAGISMDKALNATHDAVNIAQSFLPVNVKPPLIEQQKQTDGLPFIGLSLESSSLSFGELTHFANLNIKNSFRGLNGVASVSVWGQPYTYAVSLDAQKLYAFGINVNEITERMAQNNLSLPAGKYQDRIPTTLDLALKTREDYENLLIKMINNHPVYLKSLADVQLTTDNNQSRIRVNGHQGLLLSINRSNDANPLDVSIAVRKQAENIKKILPDDIKMNVIIDQSEFIQASLKNIQSSIIEAIILVLIIIFIFLRNVRATLIPVITIPVSLLGALIFLKITGFTINQMTLLAMVLAVGLVVDDAIIVLENIWRYIEDGLSPMDAAVKGSKQIGFAIVAMTLTLASVYAPIAFINGMIGQLFIEFSVALAGSVIISGIVALTLSPLMCARFLTKNSNHLLPGFDRFLSTLSNRYFNLLDAVIPRKKTIVFIILLTMAMMVLFFKILPRETAPKEDRGLIGVYTPFLSADNIDSLEEKTRHLEASINTLPEAKNKLTFIGSWGANLVLPLKEHKKRKRSSEQILTSLRAQLEQIRSFDALVWSWDSGLPGMDNAMNGSEIDLVISSPKNYRQLFNTAEMIKKALDNSNQFASTRYDLRLDSMGYTIDIDRTALAQLGLSPEQAAKTIEIFFSGDKSMTFQKDNVVYNLTLQGNKKPWSLNEIYLTTPSGKRVSLGAVARMKRQSQPASLEHVNQMRSTTINAQLPAHHSFKKGMDVMLQLAKENTGNEYKLSWTGAAKTYISSSNTMALLFILSLVFIYAILAAQFEHFLYPLIILFTVPMACFGALLLLYLFNQSLNIYSQVGLVTLIGLITKHGILIVEFANQLQKEGLNLYDAIKTSCALRLRPILMTTGAMVFGAIPLILSHEAGSEARRAIGTVLIGGLSIGTIFTLFILPSVYYLISLKWNNTGNHKYVNS